MKGLGSFLGGSEAGRHSRVSFIPSGDFRSFGEANDLGRSYSLELAPLRPRSKGSNFRIRLDTARVPGGPAPAKPDPGTPHRQPARSHASQRPPPRTVA
jgi:hypothetical protein